MKVLSRKFTIETGLHTCGIAHFFLYRKLFKYVIGALMIIVVSVNFSAAQANADLEGILNLSFEELSLLTGKVQSEDSIVRIKYALAKKYLKKDIQMSLHLFDESLEIVSRLDDKPFEIQIKKSKSLALINLQRLDEASDLIQEAIIYYREANEMDRLASSLAFVSYLKTESGEFAIALDYALKALKIFTETDNLREILGINNRIGIIYNRLGEHERAVGFFEENIRLADEKGVRFYYRTSYNNAGDTYMVMGNVEKAEQYLRKTLELGRNEKTPKSLAFGYRNMANLALLKGQDQEALTFLDSSLVLFEQINAKPSVIMVLMKRAKILKDLGNYNKYRKAVISSFEYLESWDLQTNEEEITEAYADILFEEGRLKEAYALAKKSRQIERDKRKDFKMSEIQKLEQRLKRQDEEKRILELSKEVEFRNIQYRYFVILGILAACIIGLLLYSNRIRRRKNHEITENLKEKEVLIKEIHHRVKNNLQIVSSMLNLQSRNIKDGSVKRAIVDNRDRVKSMALLHQRLYEGTNLKGVKMKPYIEKLIASLIHSYHYDEMDIDIDIKVDQLILDLDSCIPIGLIINELITNALKYAISPDSSQSLLVSLREKSGQLVLLVQDSGMIGEYSKIQEGFGFQLIRSLSRKLKGELNYEVEDGLKVRIVFHSYKKVSA